MSTKTTRSAIASDSAYAELAYRRGPKRSKATEVIERLAQSKGTTLNYLQNVYYAKGRIRPDLFAEICDRLYAAEAITGAKLEELRLAAKKNRAGA